MAKGCKYLHFLFPYNREFRSGKSFFPIRPVFSELAGGFSGRCLSEVAGLAPNVLPMNVGLQSILQQCLCKFSHMDWPLRLSSRGIGGLPTSQIRFGIPASKGCGRGVTSRVEWARGLVQ